MRALKILALPLALSVGLAAAGPTLAAKKKADPPAAGAPAATKTRSTAQLANDNKMKTCGSKWRGLSAADKAKYDGMGKTHKDKNGKPESGWIIYSVECRKA